MLSVGRHILSGCGDGPDTQFASYDDLATAAAGYASLLHLAAVNNDVDASEEAFFEVNEGLTRKVAEDARAAGIPLFVNFSSLHALPDGPDSAYARSKRAGVGALKAIEGIKIINLFLPAIHGDAYAGKLAVLEKMPVYIRPVAFKLFSSLAPTIHIDQIAEFVAPDLDALPSDEPMFLADPKEDNWVYIFARKLIDYGFAFSIILLFW